MPSLKQLHDAIASYHSDHPDVLMTVVVDATFGHRIDPKEVPEFEKEIETNAFVAPPAGAVGRGDGFILSIAQKANASILSNDSYQEFHGEYAWLFDEGRLIGGKPVPHVGWVWVNRVPVRGPVSRRSVKEQKIVDKSPSRRRGSKASDVPSISADAPMPIPSAAPPGAVMPGQKPRGGRGDSGRGADASKADAPKSDAAKSDAAKSDAAKSDTGRSDSARSDAARSDAARSEAARADAAKTTNDLLTFLSFVEHFPVGTAVTGVVETYSSHGAYVLIGDAHGYVPLRLMAEPAPRSAREVMDLGETVTLVVSSFGAARRSIDLAVPSMAPAAAPVAPDKPRRGTSKKAAAAAAAAGAAAVAAEALQAASAALDTVVADSAPAKGRRRPAKRAAAPDAPTTFDTAFADAPTAPVTKAEPTAAAPVAAATAKAPAKKASRGRKQAATAADVPPPPAVVAALPKAAARPKAGTPAKAAAKPVAKAAKRSPRLPKAPAMPAVAAVVPVAAPAPSVPAAAKKASPRRRAAKPTNPAETA